MYETDESECVFMEKVDVRADSAGINGMEEVLNPEIDTPHLENQWTRLPSLAVEKIYSYLNRTDQYHMSLVCIRWSKEYDSPSIWKYVKLSLPTRDSHTDFRSQVRFAIKYGRMFQHVEIIYHRVRSSLIDTICTQLKIFLNTLACHSQLQSVKFRRTARLFRSLNDDACKEMFRNFVQFLESQEYLRTVEFHDCCFSYEEAAELLTAITTNCATIRHLVFRGFNDSEFANTTRNDAIASSLSRIWSEKLSNLCSLEMDYSHIFESLLLSDPIIAKDFENTRPRSLSRISVHCECAKRLLFKGIPSRYWRRLKQSCLNLAVDLYFIPELRQRQDMEFYLVPDIPLRRLDYRSDRLRTSADMEIEVLFNHLRRIQCNRYLEDIYMLWMRRIPDISSVLVPFLQSCPLLKCLQLFLRHPVGRIDMLFQSLMTSRPKSLEQMVISISNVRSQEDHININAIIDEYVPVLQSLGLNTYLILEQGRF